jgi:hypothetical protein
MASAQERPDLPGNEVFFDRVATHAFAASVPGERVVAEMATVSNDIELGAKTLLDLEGRFDITDKIRLALGAENLLDEYSTRTPRTRISPARFRSRTTRRSAGRAGSCTGGRLQALRRKRRA